MEIISHWLKKYFLICLGISFWLITPSVDAKVPDAVLKQKETVVTIYIYEKDKLAVFGSGFIIDPTGIVVTNYHVIEYLLNKPDSRIAVKREGGKYLKVVEILALDKINDIALIKVDGADLPSVRLSMDYKPKQGDDVFVIGSPFGLETTISDGIVSSIRGKDDFLQITASISHGSSGSPVFNASGDVIGIATLQIEGGQNLNFAIPSKYILKVKTEIQLSKEKPQTGTLPPDNKKSSSMSPNHVEPATAGGVAPSNSFEEHIKLGRKYLKNEQMLEAIEEYTKAIAIKPNDAYLFLARGKALWSLANRADKEQSSDTDIAEATTRVKTNASKKVDYVLLDKAIEDINKAIALEPNNAIFYVMRSIIYQTKSEVGSALKDLDKATELRPDFAPLYHVRAQTYRDIKNYDMAIEDLTAAIKMNPKKEQMMELLSSLYFDMTIDDKPGLYIVRLYNERASAFKETGHHDKAIKDYQTALELEPDNSDSWLALYLMCDIKGQSKEIIAAFSSLIAMFPKEVTYYNNRASCYEKLKLNDKALKDRSMAIELEPSASNYESRGNLHKELKRYPQAINDYNKAIEHSISAKSGDNNYTAAARFKTRGDLYRDLKQYSKAINDYTKAIEYSKATELNDFAADYYYQRGEAYYITGRKQLAVYDFYKACDLGGIFSRINESCDRLAKLKKEMERGEKWTEYAHGDNIHLFYDKTSISKHSNKSVRVWIREEVDDVATFIEEKKKQGTQTEGYEHFSHAMTLFEVNCLTSQIGVASMIEYDKKGRALASWHADRTRMSPIIPDTISAALYEVICKKKRRDH